MIPAATTSGSSRDASSSRLSSRSQKMSRLALSRAATSYRSGPREAKLS